MGKFKYGKTSLSRREGVIIYIILTSELALSNSTSLDWGVGPYGGKRSPEEQNKLFKDGRSKADGYNKKSYHQSGLALDLVPVINGKMTWENRKAFLVIRKLMFDAWTSLQVQGKIPKEYYLHWGGFWGAVDKNNDGIQQENELGWDSPHFEIRKYPQKIKFPRIWDL